MLLISAFSLPAGETPDSLFKGKLVTCTVVGIVRRKPPREVLDRANPIENKNTGYWQCPFCLKNDFRELSMVSLTFYCLKCSTHDGIQCMFCNWLGDCIGDFEALSAYTAATACTACLYVLSCCIQNSITSNKHV